jgi:glucose/arabinose dehydrogenase
MGLRNPWRFSFDARTGDMAIGDEGDRATEEIDFAPAGTGTGLNYGWPAFEGRRPHGGSLSGPAVAPVFTYDHNPGCAVIAGYVVRDPALKAFAGRFLYGDLCDTRVFALQLRPGRAGRPRFTNATVPGLVSFGQDAFRRLYAVSIDGGVYRLTG